MEFTVVIDQAFWDFVTIIMCGIVVLYVPLTYKIGRMQRRIIKELDTVHRQVAVTRSNTESVYIKVDKIYTTMHKLLGTKETPDDNTDDDKEE